MSVPSNSIRAKSGKSSSRFLWRSRKALPSKSGPVFFFPWPSPTPQLVNPFSVPLELHCSRSFASPHWKVLQVPNPMAWRWDVCISLSEAFRQNIFIGMYLKIGKIYKRWPLEYKPIIRIQPCYHLFWSSYHINSNNTLHYILSLIFHCFACWNSPINR